jgi:hypothetical protein
MILSCSYGTLGALTQNGFGLSIDDSATCLEVSEAQIPAELML